MWGGVVLGIEICTRFVGRYLRVTFVFVGRSETYESAYTRESGSVNPGLENSVIIARHGKSFSLG